MYHTAHSLCSRKKGGRPLSRTRGRDLRDAEGGCLHYSCERPLLSLVLRVGRAGEKVSVLHGIGLE